MPHVDSAAVLSEDGSRLTVFAINRDLKDSVPFTLKLLDFDGFTPVTYKALEGCSLDDVNTADCEKVRPKDKPLPAVEDRRAVIGLEPASWNMIVLEKKS